MRSKRFFSLLLILLLTGGLAIVRPARADGPKEIIDVHVTVDRPHCGDEITEASPDPEVELKALSEDGELDGAVVLIESHWVSQYSREGYEAFTGPVEGDALYTVYLVLKAAEGFTFAEETIMTYTDERGWCQDLFYDERTIIMAVHVYADHVKDPENTDRDDPSCVDSGLETFICTHCGRLIISFLPIDPEAHTWGEWEILQEATTMGGGKQTRTCTLCGKVETEEIPKKTAAVYEPETSWAMPATVAWRADGTAIKTAISERRPATAIVWVDAALNIYDRNGGLISKSIDSYVKATSQNMIPAFCFQNEAEAKALLDWLRKSTLEDCFLVSAPQNQEHIKTIIANTHVKGILDFTSISEADRGTLEEMARAVKNARAEVVLLNPDCATRENTEVLQRLGVSVWVKTPAETKTLFTLYTNGVDGVLVDDYEPALEALEFFRDDAPALLRLPQIFSTEEALDSDDASEIEDFTDDDENAALTGRHRGLRVLLKTYHLGEDAAAFAEDVLWGAHSMMVDEPGALGDLLAEILPGVSDEDATKPQGRTRSGEMKLLDGAELMPIEESEDGTEMLVTWRYKTAVTVAGEDYGEYYLYSAPFTVKTEMPPTEAPTQATTEATTEAPTEPEPPEEKGPDAVAILLWILLGLAGAAFIGAMTMIVIKMVRKKK